MKLVFSHPAQIVASQVQSALQLADIECVLRNEYASGAAGVLAPLDAWVEVWLMRDCDYDRAAVVVAQLQREDSEVDWKCVHCGNTNPATFESCWSCAALNAAH